MKTTIPVNSLLRHTEPLREELARAAAEVISSGYFVLGPNVQAFERAFSAYCGVAETITVANGTDALELALRALDVEGGEVAVVANAAMYGTTAALAAGARPVFVDVSADTSNMCPEDLARVLSRSPGVRAVIATHLYGRLADIEAISRICSEKKVALVEDCAQSHGATLQDRRAGSFGALSTFSFYPTKNLGALGDGGAVVTNDGTLAGRVRQLRQYGWSAKYTNALAGGRNSRLDEIQASMLLTMLPLLDGWNARRRDVANAYSARIRNGAVKVPAQAGEEYVAHLYVVHSERRSELRDHLTAEGIQTEIHYPLPDYRQPCHAGAFDAVALPVTEFLATTALTLPCFPELTDDEVERVIDACNRF